MVMLGKGKGLGYSVAIAEFVPRLLFFKAFDLKRGVCVCVCLLGIGEVDRDKEIRV